MKKIAVFFMSLLLTAALFGCGNNGTDTTDNGIPAENGTSQTEQNSSDNGGVVKDVEKATDDVVDGVEKGVNDLTGTDSGTNNSNADGTANTEKAK
mgnify:CR=1 FL=1